MNYALSNDGDVLINPTDEDLNIIIDTLFENWNRHLCERSKELSTVFTDILIDRQQMRETSHGTG